MSATRGRKGQHTGIINKTSMREDTDHETYELADTEVTQLGDLDEKLVNAFVASNQQTEKNRPTTNNNHPWI
jgi:hypothetical protein